MVKEITKTELDSLLDDASYLEDEAEALKYVIESVPYDETPPDGMSILNKLRLIDHAQLTYYRPIIENVFSENRLQKLAEFDHYRDTFEEKSDDDDEADIQKVLSRIIKHRAALLNVFKGITLIDWEKTLRTKSGSEITLIDFTSTMIQEERKILKEIAELVMIYQNERQYQREISKKSAQRNDK
jgi:hypothetical protein